MEEPAGDALRPRQARHQGLGAHTAQQAPKQKEAPRQEPQAQAALPLSCCPSLSLVLSRSRCLLLVPPLSRAPSLSSPLSRLDSARSTPLRPARQAQVQKGAPEQEPRANSRAPSLACCFSLSLPSVLPLARAPSLSSQTGADGRGARHSRGARTLDWPRPRSARGRGHSRRTWRSIRGRWDTPLLRKSCGKG